MKLLHFLLALTHIDKEAFRNMFYEHLALTKAEALAFLNKDYEAGVKLYVKRSFRNGRHDNKRNRKAIRV